MTLSNPLRILLVAVATLQSASCFVSQRSCTQQQTKTKLYANNRRDFVRTVVAGSSAMLIPSIANAKGGDSASIVMPNYIEFLIEKNKVVDPTTLLYQGPDIELQLKRIGEAGARLPEVAALAEEKKWSQVQGIITGPLGTLLQTMNNVSNAAGTSICDIFRDPSRRTDCCAISCCGVLSSDRNRYLLFGELPPPLWRRLLMYLIIPALFIASLNYFSVEVTIPASYGNDQQQQDDNGDSTTIAVVEVI